MPDQPDSYFKVRHYRKNRQCRLPSVAAGSVLGRWASVKRRRCFPCGRDRVASAGRGGLVDPQPALLASWITSERRRASHRLRTLAEIPVEVELRGPPITPIYQRIAHEATRLHEGGFTLKAVA